MPDYLCTIQLANSNSSISAEDYNGKISIISTWETRDGQIKPNWVFRQEKKDGENVPGKSMPLKLNLGTTDEAHKILSQLLAALPGTSRPAQKQDDDIPPF